MDSTELVSRRLDTASCVIVGTQIAANLEALTRKGKSVPALIDDAVVNLTKITNTIRDAEKSDTPILELDRAVDRCAYALEALIEASKRIFSNAEMLELNDTEKALFAAMERVAALIYPEGTDFLRLTFRRQWRELQKMKKVIGENTQTIAAAGLTIYAGRLLRWIDLYGIKLGITETEGLPSGSLQSLLEQWHESLGDLLLEARYHCRDPKNAEHTELYQLMTGPYQQQIEAERKADRSARASRKTL